ncbi:MAG: hydrogenase expression protein HypE [Woeseiaceae bacterium]
MLHELTARYAQVPEHRPWPRVRVDETGWQAVAEELAAGRLGLLGLWSDGAAVHAALLDEGALSVVSIECRDGRFTSLAQRHPPALRLERAIRDLYGLESGGLADDRPWLDHGRWGVRAPLGALADAPVTGSPYRFLAAEGESLHEIPVGPVHAGIIEPGHFRFSANGETIVRLEERLGYAHKGIEALMRGSDLERAVKLAGRCSGDSTVAYAFAFARAAEAATGAEASPRAQWLRALMAELERLANHLGDFGAICNDASFALMHAHCGILRERVLRAADTSFSHRLMRDCIVPGGVAVDLDDERPIRLLVEEIQARLPALAVLYENTASLQDRTVGSGILKHELAKQYAAGGYVGRASGRDFDARRAPGYPPYGELEFEIPVLDAGDVNARVWIRIREIEQSLSLIEQILERMPAGARYSALPPQQGEGMALVEGFRGDILVWLKLGDGMRVERCHLRDPSWFQWPLLEAAIEGNIVADFPLCNKSFNCSYSGHDL